MIPTLGSQRYPQIHSILHYLDKEDPLGSFPENPLKDSQYESWERAVLEWARSNIPSFSLYNQPVPPGAVIYYASQPSPIVSAPSSSIKPFSALSIEDVSPKTGSFVSSPFLLTANLRSSVGLSRLELKYNHRLIGGLPVSGIFYHYEYKFDLPLESSNELELKVIDINGKETIHIISLNRS